MGDGLPKQHNRLQWLLSRHAIGNAQAGPLHEACASWQAAPNGAHAAARGVCQLASSAIWSRHVSAIYAAVGRGVNGIDAMLICNMMMMGCLGCTVHCPHLAVGLLAGSRACRCTADAASSPTRAPKVQQQQQQQQQQASES
jgi:hypothetical protein